MRPPIGQRCAHLVVQCHAIICFLPQIQTQTSDKSPNCRLLNCLLCLPRSYGILWTRFNHRPPEMAMRLQVPVIYTLEKGTLPGHTSLTVAIGLFLLATIIVLCVLIILSAAQMKGPQPQTHAMASPTNLSQTTWTTDATMQLTPPYVATHVPPMHNKTMKDTVI